MSFKPLSDPASKAMKHRTWKWCRRDNGFSDMPLWRVVARKSSLPLTTVLAFVNRLDELANKAEQRGSVIDFSPAEMGAALDIPDEEAARLYAVLEDGAIGWIAYDHIANFTERNRDSDGQDDTAAERNRRMRARKKAMLVIARMVARGELSTAARPLIEAQVLNDVDLSTALQRYAVTIRNDVTDTAEQSREVSKNGNFGDNTGTASGGETEGRHGSEAAAADDSPISDAARWLQTEGLRIVVEHMDWSRPKAETAIDRWLRDLPGGDPAVLQEIIEGAERTNYMGAPFHNLIVDGCKRHTRTAERGRELPLRPVIAARKEAS